VKPHFKWHSALLFHQTPASWADQKMAQFNLFTFSPVTVAQKTHSANSLCSPTCDC